MNYETVLSKIESNELSPELAYKELYPVEIPDKPGKRASFVKMKVRVPNEGRGVNTLLRIIFFFPIPISLVRWGIGLGSRFAPDLKELEDQDFDLKDIKKLIKYSKGTKIKVDSNDAIIDIKII